MGRRDHRPFRPKKFQIGARVRIKSVPNPFLHTWWYGKVGKIDAKGKSSQLAGTTTDSWYVITEPDNVSRVDRVLLDESEMELI